MGPTSRLSPHARVALPDMVGQVGPSHEPQLQSGGWLGAWDQPILSQVQPPCVVACIPVLHAYRYRSVASSYRFLLQCIWEPRC